MTKKNGFWAEEVDEAVAQRIAYIIGPGSAYGLALEEANTRRAAGEDVAIMNTGTSVVVVPRSHITNVTQLSQRLMQQQHGGCNGTEYEAGQHLRPGRAAQVGAEPSAT